MVFPQPRSTHLEDHSFGQNLNSVPWRSSFMIHANTEKEREKENKTLKADTKYVKGEILPWLRESRN